nr:MAG TPA: hypothetical protein [Caudoviricetes sp.]
MRGLFPFHLSGIHPFMVFLGTLITRPKNLGQ